jgi:hypothetical protein
VHSGSPVGQIDPQAQNFWFTLLRPFFVYCILHNHLEVDKKSSKRQTLKHHFESNTILYIVVLKNSFCQLNPKKRLKDLIIVLYCHKQIIQSYK